MKKTFLLAGASALLIAMPVHAQSAPPEAELVDRLNDPVFQEEIGDMFAGFLGAMMTLPVGEVAHAVDRALPDTIDREPLDIPPDATLGELAGKGDPDFEDRIEDKARSIPPMLGTMASVMGAMLPQLRAMGEDLRERMGDFDRRD